MKEVIDENKCICGLLYNQKRMKIIAKGISIGCRIGFLKNTPGFSTHKLSHQIQQLFSIPFENENKYFLDKIFSMDDKKQKLSQMHKQYTDELINNNEKGKKSFKDIEQYYKDLYPYIKEKILVEQEFNPDSLFISRSHYYFQKDGKKIRPIMIEMIKQSFMDDNNGQMNQNIKKWAALIEMMHISSLAHDDIIDDSPSRRGLQSQHLKYGKKAAVYSANFIIARASNVVYDFKSAKLYQIYSKAMENLATGQIIQASAKYHGNNTHQLQKLVETYLNKSYYKTAALMSNALRGVSLFHKESTLEQQIACFRVGQHFGIAFQIVDDIIDFTSTTELMGKQGLADIKDGNITAPVYFSLLTQKKQKKQAKYTLAELKNKNKPRQMNQQIKQWIFANKGIEISYILAGLHIQRGIDYLKYLPINNEQPWKYLGYKVLTRNK